jgi:tetratricopeptide (TPR) repeat protein
LARPRSVEALYNRGNVLAAAGDLGQAVECYETALSIEPDRADVLNNYGLALSALKRDQEAIKVWEDAVAAAPDHIEALYNCGHARAKLKRFEEALAFYDRVLALEPNHLNALLGQAATLYQLGRYQAAIVSYSNALALDESSIEILNRRGNAFKDMEKFDDALADFDRALAIDPENLGTLNNRGNLLLAMRRPSEALDSYERAVAIQPNHADSRNNRGVAFARLGQYEEAFACFNEALSLNSGLSQAHVNRGNTLLALNRLPEAIANYDAALDLDPECFDAHWNRSVAALGLGDLRRGWQGYEYRWSKKEFAKYKRTFPVPLWLGNRPVAGRTILLHAEQGLGDTIQFVRYVPVVARMGAQVILEVQAALRSLLAPIEGAMLTVARGHSLPPFDLYCPLLSLPLALGTELATIPAQIPYLHPRPERIALWRHRLACAQRPLVGVVWAGSSGHANDHLRSIPFEQISTLFDVSGLAFVSLQKGVKQGERWALADKGVVDLGEELADFVDTAAVISLLDMVISVDTSVAHLAGAMGRPVWILLPFAADFRWMLEREDSPWYPTARLWRQPRPRDWTPVLARVHSELRGLAKDSQDHGVRAGAPS